MPPAAMPDAAAPDDPVTARVVQLWAEVLNVPGGAIGVHDNFFRLGGNSLSAVRLVSSAYRELGVRVPVSAIFENPTAGEFTRVVREATRAEFQRIPRVELREWYELSYNQKRVWVVQQIHPDTASYNLVGTLRLDHAVDQAAVNAVLDALVERHDSLRTRFATVRGGPVQIIVESARARLMLKDLSGLRGAELELAKEQLRMGEALAPFDLTRAPLLRSTLIKFGENHCELMVNMSHMS